MGKKEGDTRAIRVRGKATTRMHKYQKTPKRLVLAEMMWDKKRAIRGTERGLGSCES